MKILSIAVLSLCYLSANGQDDKNDIISPLPYYEIPKPSETYTSGAIVSRMIDGLGFRYYWATEGLRQEDLDYVPSEGARSTFETLEHIFDLSMVVVNAPQQKENIRNDDKREMSFEEMRRKTLENLKTASELMIKSTDSDFEKYNMVFSRGEQRSESPYWNLLNGPLADALWHVGQVVSFRRSSGNPFNSKVSMFNGKVRD